MFKVNNKDTRRRRYEHVIAGWVNISKFPVRVLNG